MVKIPGNVDSIWDIAKDVPRIVGALQKYSNEIKKRWHAKRSPLPYNVALFLEHTFSPRLLCFGKTGDVVLSAQRREKIRTITSVTPAIDKRRIAESINTDLRASLELFTDLGKHKGLEFKLQIDEVLKKEYYNKSGFVIGGPVPNDTSEYFLNQIDSCTGLKFDFDLRKPDGHYPLVTPTETFEPVYDEDRQTYDTDYGIIIRVPNIRMPRNKVVLLMGCKGYATLAVAKLFTEPNLVKGDILSEINEDYCDKSFYLVVETHIGKTTGLIEKICPITLGPLKKIDEKWSLPK